MPVQAPAGASHTGTEPNIYRMLVRRANTPNAEMAVRDENGKIQLLTRSAADKVLARVPEHGVQSVAAHPMLTGSVKEESR